jgi:hypothetical protein
VITSSHFSGTFQSNFVKPDGSTILYPIGGFVWINNGKIDFDQSELVDGAPLQYQIKREFAFFAECVLPMKWVKTAKILMFNRKDQTGLVEMDEQASSSSTIYKFCRQTHCDSRMQLVAPNSSVLVRIHPETKMLLSIHNVWPKELKPTSPIFTEEEDEDDQDDQDQEEDQEVTHLATPSTLTTLSKKRKVCSQNYEDLPLTELSKRKKYWADEAIHSHRMVDPDVRVVFRPELAALAAQHVLVANGVSFKLTGKQREYQTMLHSLNKYWDGIDPSIRDQNLLVLNNAIDYMISRKPNPMKAPNASNAE